MIRYIGGGDLLDSPMQTLVNPVNTEGVMGKGLALRFRNMYRDMYKQYQKDCISGEISIGRLTLYESGDYKVINFPTKQYYKNPSKIEYIRSGLEYFLMLYQEWGITSIAFPKLGCGNGGLDWNNVKPVMELYLSAISIPVDIHI